MYNFIFICVLSQTSLYASQSHTQSPSHSTKNRSETRTELRVFVIPGHSPKAMQQKRWDLGDVTDIPAGYKNRYLTVPKASVHSIAYAQTKKYAAPNRYRSVQRERISPEAQEQIEELYIEAETPAIHEELKNPKSCCAIQ